MEIDGVEISECSDHLKLRLQTVSRDQSASAPDVHGGKRSASYDIHHMEATGNSAESARMDVRLATPHPGKRRNSTPAAVDRGDDQEEPPMRKKAYCLGDPIDTKANRFDESDDSIERDLEFLHIR